MKDPIIFENVKKVIFNESRWDVTIIIVDKDGKEHKFIASADSFYSEQDHIWFGTEADYEEYTDHY